MVNFKELSKKAATVVVDGEGVFLRYPLPDDKKEVGDLGRAVKVPTADEPLTREESAENLLLYQKMCAKALHATVVATDDMEEDDWLRIVTAADNNDAIDGLLDLVDTAMRLCGYDTTIGRPAADTDEGTGNVTDHVKEAAEELGTVPST